MHLRDDERTVQLGHGSVDTRYLIKELPEKAQAHRETRYDAPLLRWEELRPRQQAEHVAQQVALNGPGRE